MFVDDRRWKELTGLAEIAETIFVTIIIVIIDPKIGATKLSQSITKTKVSTHNSSTARLMDFSSANFHFFNHFLESKKLEINRTIPPLMPRR